MWGKETCAPDVSTKASGWRRGADRETNAQLAEIRVLPRLVRRSERSAHLSLSQSGVPAYCLLPVPGALAQAGNEGSGRRRNWELLRWEPRRPRSGGRSREK